MKFGSVLRDWEIYKVDRRTDLDSATSPTHDEGMVRDIHKLADWLVKVTREGIAIENKHDVPQAEMKIEKRRRGA